MGYAGEARTDDRRRRSPAALRPFPTARNTRPPLNAVSRLRSLAAHPRSIPLVAAVVAWLAVCYGVWYGAAEHSLTAGEGVIAMPGHWPAGAAVQRADDRPTLVLCMHPRCPCTAASVETLGSVCHTADGAIPPKVIVLVSVPPAAGPDWLETSSVRSVRQMSGAEVIVDRSGRLSRRFGAATSGTVFLFSPTGDCLFGGGVTAGRGHAGANAGLLALQQAIEVGESAGADDFPVFGCRLCEPPRPAMASKSDVGVSYDR